MGFGYTKPFFSVSGVTLLADMALYDIKIILRLLKLAFLSL